MRGVSLSGGLPALPGAVLAEFRDLKLSGPGARTAFAAGLAVGLAIFLALLLHLQAPYWAGISAFVCIQANQPQSLQKGLHRVLGTLAGAGVALLVFPWIAYDHFGVLLLLFAAGTVAILGSQLSSYAYAWLLGGITTIMVVLGAIDDPAALLSLAFYRSAEITLGTSAALTVAKFMLPVATVSTKAAPGWRSLFDDHWHVLNHAMQCGCAVALVPVIFRVFELPNIGQMAISIGAVMAVPVLTGRAAEDHRAVTRRAAQRLLGCLFGGGAGLLFLTSPMAAFFPAWLLTVMAGAAIGAQLETGRQGVATVGIQAVVALILTMVQGWGPAESLMPALDRMAGISGAIMLLLAMGWVFSAPELDKAGRKALPADGA